MTASRARCRIGVDVGGTFTDFVLVDESRDLVFTGKQLTTSSDPGIAICEGVERIAREAGLELAAIDGVVHGTTLVANTIIERTGARVGLITTRGFRDVLEVGTEMRYDLYDLFLEKAEPLVPRDRRLTVDERIDSVGDVLQPMDEAELRKAAQALVGMDVEAVAVCFVNSYVNPVHERGAHEILTELFPALPLTVSTMVAPEIREYERACTAAANAYVMPLMRRYALVATGGAGPVHAWGLARLLGIRRIVCPLAAGVTSSLGFLIAAPATDRAHSHVSRVESVSADTVNAFYDAMAADATRALVEAGGDAATIAVERRVEMRYVGQGFEIEVAVPGGVLGPDLGVVLHERFLDRYDELFGRRIRGVAVETVTWRLTASGPTPNVNLNFRGQRIEAGTAQKGERQVHFPDTGFASCKVYNRYGLAAGTKLRGPAVVEERESTVVAGPDTTVSIDRYLNLIIDIDESRPT